MGAYGDIECDVCKERYYELDKHECCLDDVRLRIIYDGYTIDKLQAEVTKLRDALIFIVESADDDESYLRGLARQALQEAE